MQNHRNRKSLATGVALAVLMLASRAALALDVSGTPTFSGSVVFQSAISGITLSDLTVSSGPYIDTLGNGYSCSYTAPGSAPVAADGSYPETGTLAVGVQASKGGPNPPDDGCLIQLQANGNDGGDVSAHGTINVAVTLTDIQSNAAIVVPDDIPVRQSKTHAGLTKDCLKWVKKQIKLGGKCNAQLWKLGGTEGSLKCKANDPEPAGCDPLDYSEEVLALSFGDMDQQVNAPAAMMIDTDVLADQAKCQKYIGKAAVNFFTKRNQLVQKNCVDAVADSSACRDQAGKDAATKLSLIDNCITAQGVDMTSGLTIMDVDDPCRSECITAGVLDRKCLKDCFNTQLSEISDVLIGDIPVCGNGVVQAGEACDDGNTVSGDCCSSICGNEPAGSQSCGTGACMVTVAQCSGGAPVTCTPGTPSAEICNDGIDNDCDGLTDSADPDCP